MLANDFVVPNSSEDEEESLKLNYANNRELQNTFFVIPKE